jgi:hypothetical protein
VQKKLSNFTDRINVIVAKMTTDIYIFSSPAIISLSAVSFICGTVPEFQISFRVFLFFIVYYTLYKEQQLTISK